MNSSQRLSWKSKLFGDTRTNFYGWIAAGIITMAGSIWFVILALRAGGGHSPICLMLVAIYFIAVGHFGIALQNYCSRLARKLDETQKDDANA